MKIEVDQLEKTPVYLPDIREELCDEVRGLLEEYEGHIEGLQEEVGSREVDEIVDTDAATTEVAANMIREISRKLIEEYDSLSSDEIAALEAMNNHLAEIIFGLEEDERQALSQI